MLCPPRRPSTARMVQPIRPNQVWAPDASYIPMVKSHAGGGSLTPAAQAFVKLPRKASSARSVLPAVLFESSSRKRLWLRNACIATRMAVNRPLINGVERLPHPANLDKDNLGSAAVARTERPSMGTRFGNRELPAAGEHSKAPVVLSSKPLLLLPGSHLDRRPQLRHSSLRKNLQTVTVTSSSRARVTNHCTGVAVIALPQPH